MHGIDFSEAMVARLRAKPGAERVSVTVGDFATATAGRTFRLVYLVYNTIGNLTSQDDQVECFRNAAAHLEPGGHFVIEVGVPVPLCVASRTGPDGPASRDAAAGPLGRLEPRAIHRRQHQAHLGLAQVRRDP